MNRSGGERRLPIYCAIFAYVVFVRIAPAQWAHGSTILLLVRDSVAYLATDSRTNSELGAEETGCKIVCSNYKVIGLSGILAARDLHFSLRNELQSIVQESPADSINTAVRKLQQRISDVLLSGQRTKTLPDSLLAVGILGCEFIKDVHVTTMVRYTVTSDGRFRVQSSLSTGNHLFCEGVTTAIQDLIPRNFGRHDPIAALDSLMNLQEFATPAAVGGATDVVRLTKNGYEWIRKKQNCPN
jgi:hypothetical protein